MCCEEEKRCRDFNLELVYHIIAAFRHPVPVILSKDGLGALEAVKASLDTTHFFLSCF